MDKFAQVNLREFLVNFARLAIESIKPVNIYFEHFGIAVEDIQIIDFACSNYKTQNLLEMDIVTNVTKQNELRGKQMSVTIQEQRNEVMRKQKDLEVQMAMKVSLV